eukprot:CAMPEP_0202752180 /NCGR_PEP_ID=MMETSP1388-20130828/12646_1 /ASSEMBLY_ACC=CAM_ASM_000864 /TAXON_ID=37098 /ORGANISM="Isochrysis sp, Strain CCMP1244" /LENGTH=144 /DNA_ID=CAMNT_0049419865 /DNA_START=283 /DNA_END=715 /DNA_ORIENTATION=-
MQAGRRRWKAAGGDCTAVRSARRLLVRQHAQDVLVAEEHKSSSPSVTSLPPYCGSITLSSTLTPIGSSDPSLSRRPGPTEITTPSLSLLWVDSGSSTPPIDLVGGSMRWTSTRSSSGTRRRAAICRTWRPLELRKRGRGDFGGA